VRKVLWDGMLPKDERPLLSRVCGTGSRPLRENTFFSAKRIFVYFRNSSGALLMPEGKFREEGYLI